MNNMAFFYETYPRWLIEKQAGYIFLLFLIG